MEYRGRFRKHDGSSRSSNIVKVLTRLNWEEFDRLRKTIWYLIHKNEQTTIHIDFKSTEIVYPNGIVPLIVFIKHYQNEGIDFVIIPPVSVKLNKLIGFEGWFHAIDPNRFGEPSIFGYNSLPLKRFTDDDELNASVNAAIEVAIRNLNLAKSVPDAFEWTLNELAGNVLHHADIDEGYLQVNTFKGSGSLSLIVVDGGIGVPRSMRMRFTDLRNDRLALERALQKGVTSKPDFGQGNGLAGCVAIALASSGTFALTSGGARATVEQGRVAVRDFSPSVFGTVVELQIPTTVEIDLPSTLGGHSPSGYIEERYATESNTIRLNLVECAPTFGNRITGEKVRTMIQNLLNSNPHGDIEIDFAGINVIASSFADEVFGKLFLLLGPLEFGSRIRYIGVNGTCKQIMDSAIQERAVQGLAK